MTKFYIFDLDLVFILSMGWHNNNNNNVVCSYRTFPPTSEVSSRL
jgi:hypothetical protein